jgi:hypothetical protein
MAIYLLAPALDTLLMKVPPRVMIPVTSGLMAIFVFDALYSLLINQNTGTGITDMGSRTLTAHTTDHTGRTAGPGGDRS